MYIVKRTIPTPTLDPTRLSNLDAYVSLTNPKMTP